MKKFLSLTLAAAMVMSLASVAFASGDKLTIMMDKNDPAYETYFGENKDGYVAKRDDNVTVVFGDTAYFPLLGKNAAGEKELVYETAAVKGLKLKDEWHMGEKYVEDVSLVKRKTDKNVAETVGAHTTDLQGARKYNYYIAVELKDTMKDEDVDIFGTVTLDKKHTKSSVAGPVPGASDPDAGAFIDANGYYNDEIDDVEVEVNMTIGYVPAADDHEVEENRKIHLFSENEEDEFELTIVDPETALFTVDTRGQGDLVMSANNDFNAAISRKFPMANLEFLNIEASDSFNRIGELRVYAEEGNYLYALNEDGEVVNSKARYDDDDECYVMRTRNLNGSFVISDVELNAAPTAPVAPVVPEVKPFNPSTGAAC